MAGDLSISSSQTEAQLAQYMSDISVALINASTSKKEREDAQDFAREQTQEAYAQDLEQWNRTNLYNSPAEQRKRLEQAGISAWTQFGKFGAESPMIKAPITPTLPPTQGVQLPQFNILGAYYTAKNLDNQTKLMEASLERNALENKYQEMQNVITKYFIENQMKNKAQWEQNEENRKQGQYEALINEYNAKIEEHNETLARMKFERENLWKYDEDAKKYGIIQMQKNIYKTQQEIVNLYKEGKLKDADLNLKNADVILKGMDIGKRRELDKLEIQQQKGLLRHTELDLETEEYAKELRNEYGINYNKDNWLSRSVLKSAQQYQNWMNTTFRRGRGAFERKTPFNHETRLED